MNNLPRHIAIVMDGNGRWAKDKQWPRIAGHQEGAKTVRKVIEFCVRKKVEVLTLFALSVENHNFRPPAEVSFLMELFFESLKQNTEQLHKNNIRVLIIGDRSIFNANLLESINEIESLTAQNNGLNLILAINYSGRWDITQAVKKIAEAVKQNIYNSSDVDEAFVSSHLSLANLPEPDLLIRTSGEQRISNFLLWHFAYTEMYFCPTFWPDFNEQHLEEALSFYQTRQRRFGQTDIPEKYVTGV